MQCSYIFILRLHPISIQFTPSVPSPVVPSSIQRHRCQAQSAIEQPRDGHRFPGMDLPAVAPIGIQPTTPNSYPQLPPKMVKMLRVYQPTATFIADKSKISDLAPLHLRLLTPTFPGSLFQACEGSPAAHISRRFCPKIGYPMDRHGIYPAILP